MKKAHQLGRGYNNKHQALNQKKINRYVFFNLKKKREYGVDEKAEEKQCQNN